MGCFSDVGFDVGVTTVGAEFAWIGPVAGFLACRSVCVLGGMICVGAAVFCAWVRAVPGGVPAAGPVDGTEARPLGGVGAAALASWPSAVNSPERFTIGFFKTIGLRSRRGTFAGRNFHLHRVIDDLG